jgi:predicted phage terminase large subunit-like protein
LTEKDVKIAKIAKVKCDKSLLYFTRYFFKHRFNRKFIVNVHHEIICEALERVLSGQCKRLIINIAPRYGKTELAVKNFIAHALSLNPSARFIHLSYSDDLALDNSEAIKDLVNEDSYQSMHPHVRIKKDSKAKKKWYTTEGGGVYATSAGGAVTGFGAGTVDEDEDVHEFLDYIEKEKFGGALVIDDPIKPDDAESALKRNTINNKYDSTHKNRVNSRNTPIIVIMQRVHPNDLCGHLIDEGLEDWEVLSLPCINVNDGVETPLWDFKHTIEELYEIRGKTPHSISTFERQYMQNPKPLEGLLYTKFLTYDEIDFDIGRVCSYVDTADTGKDHLCSIVWTERNGLKYVLDIIYTQLPNEYTEPMLSKQCNDFDVNDAYIESNNGGRAFARNVSRINLESGNRKTIIHPFHQSKNKESRIKSNSSTVQNTVVYPKDWVTRWPAFYDSMTTYMAAGKNEFDDAQDTATGIVEKSSKKRGVKSVNRRR